VLPARPNGARCPLDRVCLGTEAKAYRDLWRMLGKGNVTSCNEGRAMSDIAERVKKVVIERLGIEASTDTANVSDNLTAGSPDKIDLVMASRKNAVAAFPMAPSGPNDRQCREIH
jgi:hypothetical protein